MEKNDRMYQQGDGKDTIAGVHGRSWRISVRLQRANRRPGHSSRHPNHQQGGRSRQHQSDGRKARRTGVHTNESPGGTRTQQSKKQSAAKQQVPGQGGQPSRSRQQTPVVAADEPPREKIYLSKESMAMVKEVVALGRLLPPDASRDELRAYNKLAGELTQQ